MEFKMKKVNWGILSTAKIGLNSVIPAMQQGHYSEITAIASRDLEKAKNAARKLAIPKYYPSYEELLEDKDVEAIYIPLPNHLHVEWVLKSLREGKHVLCEKPLSMNLKEAEYLQREVQKFPDLKVMEAFMYRHHPQTKVVKKLVDEKRIGELKNIHSHFSYHNTNPQDIRNQKNIGGGGLLDIGCYCISLSRYLFNSEPERVCGIIDYDPKLKIDRLTSAILEFKKGASVFTCSTQMTPHQYAKILGTNGRIDIEFPFTSPAEKPAKIYYHTGSDFNELVFDASNQYTIQGDLFSQAILNDTPVPTPIEDGVANMRVIERIFESSKTGTWLNV
jgi:predicted dehydrogenase